MVPVEDIQENKETFLLHVWIVLIIFFYFFSISISISFSLSFLRTLNARALPLPSSPFISLSLILTHLIPVSLVPPLIVVIFIYIPKIPFLYDYW